VNSEIRRLIAEFPFGKMKCIFVCLVRYTYSSVAPLGPRRRKAQQRLTERAVDRLIKGISPKR
jgi:hypothetical protein